jgi:hypothetical protein
VFQGGQDASSLTGISWTVNGANVTVTTNSANAKVQGSPSDNYVVAKSGGSLPVGTIVYIPASMNSRITGLGVFSDGSTQIVVDQTI